MIKLRVQGTKNDIQLICEMMKKDPRIEIIQVSEIYSNKGTNKYFRWYADVQIVEFKEDK